MHLFSKSVLAATFFMSVAYTHDQYHALGAGSGVFRRGLRLALYIFFGAVSLRSTAVMDWKAGPRAFDLPRFGMNSV